MHRAGQRLGISCEGRMRHLRPSISHAALLLLLVVVVVESASCY
jgi:hypothetical protein